MSNDDNEIYYSMIEMLFILVRTHHCIEILSDLVCLLPKLK